jgi:hypothetical protein
LRYPNTFTPEVLAAADARRTAQVVLGALSDPAGKDIQLCRLPVLDAGGDDANILSYQPGRDE